MLSGGATEERFILLALLRLVLLKLTRDPLPA